MIFKRIIAALDFTTMDDSILNYLDFLSDFAETEQIYLMHIIKDLAKPKNVALEMHKFFRPDEPLDEKLKLTLEQTAEKHLTLSPDIQVDVEVHEGNPVEKMLHWAEVKNVDLVAFGRKHLSSGSGLTAKRMANRLKCNMLFVPQGQAPTIRRIVVPVDYSEHSIKALKTALSLADKMPDLEIVALHVIEMMPVNHFPADTAYQEYANLMSEINLKSYEKMLAENDISADQLKKVFIENSPYTIPKAINEYLKENPCDLVVIGAQGHSRIRNFFFGSTTERFIGLYDSSPILIIR